MPDADEIVASYKICYLSRFLLSIEACLAYNIFLGETYLFTGITTPENPKLNRVHFFLPECICIEIFI